MQPNSHRQTQLYVSSFPRQSEVAVAFHWHQSPLRTPYAIIMWASCYVSVSWKIFSYITLLTFEISESVWHFKEGPLVNDTVCFFFFFFSRMSSRFFFSVARLRRMLQQNKRDFACFFVFLVKHSCAFFSCVLS